MGIKLMVEVLDHAPPNLTPAERLVLIALAEKARDETRQVTWRPEGEASLVDMLVQRTGLQPRGLTKVFNRLAQRGLEVRVPIATDNRGRPLWACRGRSMEFRIPGLPAIAAPTGAPIAAMPAPQAHQSSGNAAPIGAVADPTGAAIPSNAAPVGAALSLRPSDPQTGAREDRSPDRRAATTALVARLGCDPELAATAVDAVARAGFARDLGALMASLKLADVERWAAKTTPASKSRPPLTACRDSNCADGWLGYNENEQPIPCLICRPHLAGRTSSVLTTSQTDRRASA